MSLSPGSRVGPYEIVSTLGAGGMGEVFRARDTRLDREVAVKVLPAAFAADQDQRARFDREARAVASLKHPNICTLHDIGSDEGTDYLVMELVEGETVGARLERGPLPIGDVLRVGAQIADALDAAHRRGLVHRDLKPANIMLVSSESGRSRAVQAKLLDFGLAKPGQGPVGLHGGPAGNATAAQMRTSLAPITMQGTIVGTFHYMSPEQVEGREVDGRTDIWSLGATLYEMATGARPFEATSTASLISAVLRDEPRAMAERLPLAPPAFERAIRQCLAKDADDRWQTAGDLKRELEWIATSAIAVAPAATAATGEIAVASTPLWRSRTALVAGGALMAALASIGGFWVGRSQAPAGPDSWSAFTQLTDAAGEETAPSLAPDGASFAYASRHRGSWDIYVQRVGGRTTIPVAASPERDESWPAFSPDGQRIAFSESDGDGGIFVVGATGESVNRLTDFGFNPTWSPKGDRIAFVAQELGTPYSRSLTMSALWVVGARGGAPTRLYDGDAMQPAWSPSGDRIAFWQNVSGQRDLATISVDGGVAAVLLDDAPLDWSPTWSPDGRSVYFSSDRGGSMGLWRLAVEVQTGQALGVPEPVAGSADASIALASFSSDGRSLLFRSEIFSVNPVAVPFDPATERAGQPRDIVRGSVILSPSSVSPDGQWLAVGTIGAARQEDIFLLRADGSELRRLTDDIARDRIPRFTPDGSALTFYSNREGPYGAWSIGTDGSGLTPLTTKFDSGVMYPVFAPSATTLLARSQRTYQAFLLRPPWPATMSNSKPLTGLTLARGELVPTLWSPDGRWLSGYIMASSGAPVGFGVYELASGVARAVSEDGGLFEAPWLPDSRRLIYVTRKGELVVVDAVSGARRAVLSGLAPSDLDTGAMAPDGRTFYYGAARVESNIWRLQRR